MATAKWIMLVVLCSGLAFYVGSTQQRQPVSGDDEQNLSLLPPVARCNTEPAPTLEPVTVQDSTQTKVNEPNPQNPTCDYQMYQNNLKRLESLQKAHSGVLNELSSVMNILRENNLDSPDNLTQEEIDEALPEPFNHVITYSSTAIRNKYKEHLDSPKSDSWAFRMETLINDHFMLHDRGTELILDKVICKTNTCEIRGYEIVLGASSEPVRQVYRHPELMGVLDGGYSSSGDFKGEVNGVDVVGFFYMFLPFKSGS